MKIARKVDIISSGSFPRTMLWGEAALDVEDCIAGVDWPHGSGSFSLNPAPGIRRDGRPDRNPNGVLPIKLPVIAGLEKRGWMTESLPPIASQQLLKTGDLDALLSARGRYVGFEWETGNVSSSHRAISKLLDGLRKGAIAGGFLVVPDRRMSRHLTERVGNFEELEPYFDFWSAYPVNNGALRIYGVTYDQLDQAAPHIPKSTSGRALG